MNPRLSLASLMLMVLVACASGSPRIQLPIRTEANCESRSVKQTAINSIVASTDDTIRAGAYPGDVAMRKIVRTRGGVFAYWRDQPFRAPDTAKALGVSGDLLLKRAVLTNDIDTSTPEHWRLVWLTFATPSGDRTVLERAYDVQNVCIEGRREA